MWYQKLCFVIKNQCFVTDRNVIHFFYYIFHAFHKLWQIIRYQIFVKVWEGILQKEQVIFRYIIDDMVANADKAVNNALRFS